MNISSHISTKQCLQCQTCEYENGVELLESERPLSDVTGQLN